MRNHLTDQDLSVAFDTNDRNVTTDVVLHFSLFPLANATMLLVFALDNLLWTLLLMFGNNLALNIGLAPFARYQLSTTLFLMSRQLACYDFLPRVAKIAQSRSKVTLGCLVLFHGSRWPTVLAFW
jgi:hypothetical protein